MIIKLHPVQSLRNVVSQIGSAVSASAEFTRAAHQRQASLDGGQDGGQAGTTRVAPLL